MQRLSLQFFHDLGASLRPLSDLQAGTKFLDIWQLLFKAQTNLDSLLGTQWLFGSFKSSWTLGNTLSKSLKNVIEDANYERALAPMEIYSITNALSAYEPVLRAELAVADAYFVTRKGAYDTLALISDAGALFPASLGTKVPEALSEVQEAGKCLAFEVCTAAGVHMLRAMEIVLKRYFKAVTKNEPLPKNRNLGAYIKRLEELGAGSEKVRSVLTQIKDLHRNPLMHPEETLDKEAAIGLFGIVISAISAMLKEIPQPPQQGALSLAGPVP